MSDNSYSDNSDIDYEEDKYIDGVEDEYNLYGSTDDDVDEDGCLKLPTYLIMHEKNKMKNQPVAKLPKKEIPLTTPRRVTDINSLKSPPKRIIVNRVAAREPTSKMDTAVKTIGGMWKK